MREDHRLQDRARPINSRHGIARGVWGPHRSGRWAATLKHRPRKVDSDDRAALLDFNVSVGVAVIQSIRTRLKTWARDFSGN
jgi:hypothetical protein